MIAKSGCVLPLLGLGLFVSQALAADAKVGEAAPAFTLTDCAGKTHNLTDYKGKVIVIEWINRGCPYSVKCNPIMIETSTRYAKKGVVWLAIDSTYGDKAEDNSAYIKEKGIPYPILMDGDGAVGKAYGAKTTPHMFVIGADGNVAYIGAIDDQKGKDGRNYVAEALDALLAGKAVELTKTRPYGCGVKYKR